MKLFDIQGDKVVIHNETLGIPCFRKLWETEKDKSKVTDYISYIVFRHKYDSHYLKAYGEIKAEAILKDKLFGDETFELPELVKECEREYLELTNTLFLKLIKNTRNRLEGISNSYALAYASGEILSDEEIKVASAGMEKLGNIAKSLEILEEKAKKEETMMTTKVRGGTDINPFEVPNR